MAWFRVDDRISIHRKTLRIPIEHRAEAMGLWLLAGTHSALLRADGNVPRDILGQYGTSEDVAKRLVSAGFWEETQEGFKFINWEEFQFTREEHESRKTAEAERKRRWRESRRGVPAMSHGTKTDETSPDAASSPPDPTRPVYKESGRRGNKTPLPSDWKPTQKHRETALARGINLDHEAEQFRNHAEANDRRQVSWNAAFAQWLGNAKPRPHVPHARTGRLWQE